MYKAVVFDMDGVIFDTEKLYRKVETEEGLSRGVPEDVMKKVLDMIAGGNKHTNKPKFEATVGRGIDYFDFRECMLKRFDESVEKNGVEFKDGVVETLEFLKSKGVPIGLATSTSKERASKYFAKTGVDKYFDVMVFGDNLKNGKPAPDIYLMACEQLGVEPANAIGVEDSINGVKSSATAGMCAIMVIDLIQPTDEIREIAGEICDNVREIQKYFE